MSLGINFFAGSQVSFTKQNNEKSRFGELPVDQMEGTMSNAVFSELKNLYSYDGTQDLA